MNIPSIYQYGRRMVAVSLTATMLLSILPTTIAKGLNLSDTSTTQKQVNSDYVAADWKFDKQSGVSSGSIAEGNLILKDQTNHGNDLKMQLYVNSQPTEDTKAANWENYLSFSDDSMTGQGGSMIFNGDNGTTDKNSRTGADFITVDNAPINDETFTNGYTLEFLYHFPKDWTASDEWMSLIARQGEGGGNSEGEQGTMYASISNCKEIQFITGNAAGNHSMENAAWSISMDEGGVWYHIAVISDGHTISTYVNGCEAFRDYVSDEMVGMYADPNDGRFRIGSSWWKEGTQTLDKFLQGGLQEVRISTQALDRGNWLVPNPEQYVGTFGSNKPYELRNKDNYNIVLLPDTQNTVEYRPNVMKKAIDELIDTSDDLNVAGVVGLGDVVDDYIDDVQYIHARDSFYSLPDAGIKFLIQMGNHDGSSDSDENAHNYHNSFSGEAPAWTRRTGWYLTQSPNSNGNSSYMFLRAGSYNYLVISLSCVGNDSTEWDSADEAWLKTVLNEYPNCPTIITTHDLQNCSDTVPSDIKLSSQGEKLWNIVKDYDQVFMLVGGHSHGSGVETLTNTNGKEVLSVLTDLQFAYNGGNGWFRYLEFDEQANKIYYSIYSPYVASLSEDEKSFFDVNFLTGKGNEGEFDFNFKERFSNMAVAQSTEADKGKWMSGEYHTHTGQSKDATAPFMSLNNVLASAFHNTDILQNKDNTKAKFDNVTHGKAFDFLGLSDHLRQSYNGVDGQGNGKHNTAFYVAAQTQMREIEKLQVKGLYTDKIMNTGFEWDMPGLDHASVGVLDKDGDTSVNGIHKFEWLFASTASGDDPTSLFELDEKNDDVNEQSTYGERQNDGTPEAAYHAVSWLQKNYPNSYALPNHPSRHNGNSGAVTIEALRKLNDAAPRVVFGMEGMPGNQMSGSGRCELPAGAIRNGADEMIAVTGGVWDALLSEGRKFYNFANSDFHFKVSADEKYSSGYWPSEYSSNHIWVEPGEDKTFSYSDVVEGMRSGNSYSVYGNLISDLQFTASNSGNEATMGGDLKTNKNAPVTVTIRFKSDNTNNYKSLYNTNTNIAVDNTPVLDHVDLIMGHVTGKVDESNYNSTGNTDAKIVKTFHKDELANALGNDGYYTLTYTVNADTDLYFRVRGTTVSTVDEHGDPLADADYSGTVDNLTRFDQINDSNYSSLSFYANPIWVSVNGDSNSSESSTYGVIVDSKIKNGSVRVSPQNASKGETVTITVTPNDSYLLDTLTVTDKSGNTLTSAKKGDSAYTITMPNSQVTVAANFTKRNMPSNTVDFTDVRADALYHDAVQWAIAQGITAGTSTTTFQPDDFCTRAEMVTFLWRAAGSPTPKRTENPFSDLFADAYYYDAVLWAAENGINAGTSSTTFQPDATVTKGQVMTFLKHHTDSSENFNPNDSCTRAEVVTLLYRNAQSTPYTPAA